jgi:hypothetical protein
MIVRMHDGPLGGSPSERASRLAIEVPELGASVLRDWIALDKAHPRRKAALVAHAILPKALTMMTAYMDTAELDQLSEDLWILGFVTFEEENEACLEFIALMETPRERRPTQAEIAGSLKGEVRAREDISPSAPSIVAAPSSSIVAPASPAATQAPDKSVFEVSREVIRLSALEAAKKLRAYPKPFQEQVIEMIEEGRVR